MRKVRKSATDVRSWVVIRLLRLRENFTFASLRKIILHPPAAILLITTLILIGSVLNKRDDGIRSRPTVAATTPPVVVPAPKQTPTREEWIAEQDLQAQRDMAQWAYLMLLVTGIGVIFTGSGLLLLALTLNWTRFAAGEARRAATAAEGAVVVTRDIGQKQVRAYLNVSDVQIHVNEATGAVTVSLAVANSGNSPALEVEAVLRLQSGSTECFFPMGFWYCILQRDSEQRGNRSC